MLAEIYHPDDISGKYNPEVEIFYQEQIKANPTSAWAHWCLIQLHLTHAQGRKAIEAFRQALPHFPTPNVEVLKKLHWRVLYGFIDTASWEQYWEEIVASIPEGLKAEKIHQSLLRLIFMHDEASSDSIRSVVPSHKLYDGWWKDGPFILDKNNLVKWLALYVTHIDPPGYPGRSQFCASAAEIFVDKPDEKPNFGWFYRDLKDCIKYMPEETLRENVNWFLELGLYKDEGGSVVIKAWPRTKPEEYYKWYSTLGLDCLKPDLDSMRYLRNANL